MSNRTDSSPNMQYTPVAPPSYNEKDVNSTLLQPSVATPNQAYQMNIQQQQPPGTVVMERQVVMVVENPNNSRNSCRVVCPNCNQQVITKTEKEPGMMAFVLCCLTGCCCLLCADCLMDVHHTCPQCHHKIATCQK